MIVMEHHTRYGRRVNTKEYKVETILTIGNSGGEVTLEHITFPAVEGVSAENHASALRQATEKVAQVLRDGGNFKWNPVSMSNPNGYIIGTLKNDMTLEGFVKVTEAGEHKWDQRRKTV